MADLPKNKWVSVWTPVGVTDKKVCVTVGTSRECAWRRFPFAIPWKGNFKEKKCWGKRGIAVIQIRSPVDTWYEVYDEGDRP